MPIMAVNKPCNMNNEAYEVIEYKGYSINIYTDTDTMNPIQEFDNLGTFASFHSRYDLSSGNCQTSGGKRKNPEYNFYNTEDLAEFLKTEKPIFLPLRLYDHSGITISTGKNYPYNDQWDSIGIGVIFVERSKI